MNIGVNFENDKHAFYYFKKVAGNWNEKGYTKTSLNLNKLPEGIFLRIITADYDIFDGLLTDNSDGEIELTNKYRDAINVIPYEVINYNGTNAKELPFFDEEARPEHNPTAFIGVYINHGQVNKARKRSARD